RTLAGEAEAKDRDDMECIAAVIVNRMNLPNWPGSAAQVCQQPWQFSCWNVGDPGRARILALAKTDPLYLECREVAAAALEGRLPDRTNRATHYYASYITMPAWAKGKTPSYSNTAGKYTHHFFNDIDTPPPASPAQALDQARPLAQTRTVKGAQAALGGGAVIAGAMEIAQQARDVLPVLDSLRAWSPWLVLAVAGAGIAYMVWARLDDRRQGLR
ncbi:MAG: cell wall hydrolase, partial [Magnetospirillum sp.]|nr:cell wall hydrolase [Magnetospirillum sp.]